MGQFLGPETDIMGNQYFMETKLGYLTPSLYVKSPYIIVLSIIIFY